MFQNVQTSLIHEHSAGLCSDDYSVVWLESGRITVEGHDTENSSALLKRGQSFRLCPVGHSRIVVFSLNKIAQRTGDQYADISGTSVLLRLDQVTFPPGAIAYRHVHPGAGYRVLVKGRLEIISDHDQQTVGPGDAWFEPAHSPVRAEASLTAPQSSFVRCMILPVEYQGKPTIEILDPEDAKLPRLQTTNRIIDEVIQVSSG